MGLIFYVVLCILGKIALLISDFHVLCWTLKSTELYVLISCLKVCYASYE